MADCFHKIYSFKSVVFQVIESFSVHFLGGYRNDFEVPQHCFFPSVAPVGCVVEMLQGQ